MDSFGLMVAGAWLSVCVGIVWFTILLNKAWIPFWKLFFSMFGLIAIACAYLCVCYWVGCEYSYVGGWFLFLVVLFMPIKFESRKNNVIHS